MPRVRDGASKLTGLCGIDHVKPQASCSLPTLWTRFADNHLCRTSQTCRRRAEDTDRARARDENGVTRSDAADPNGVQTDGGRLD